MDKLAKSHVYTKLALLLLCHFLLSIPSLWVPYYNIDELTNAIYAKFITSGDLTLKDFVGNTYLLTHYLYAGIVYLFGSESLMPVHIVHAIWKAFTIIALYWAGRQLGDKKSGIWSATFYCFYSLCFMSKDFHTPSAESFSLMPAALAAGFLFRKKNRHCLFNFFMAGVFGAIATMFKAPMGVILAAMGAYFLVRWKDFLKNIVVNQTGFWLVLSLPMFLVQPFGAGFEKMWEMLSGNTAIYIQSYQEISFFYWFIKYLIRTHLVLLCMLGMTIFAFYPAKTLVHLRRKHRFYWQKIFFLYVWLFLLWFAVAIGKRVFYHYFVFLLVPLALLAGAGIKSFDTRLKAYIHHKVQKHDERFDFLRAFRKRIWFFILFPVLIFSIEGAFNFSTKPINLKEITNFVKKETNENDRVYIWGNVPQIYFYSGRQPSTTNFWSDILAGTSPGSPAMEYVRATGDKLTLTQKLIKDFQHKVFSERSIISLRKRTTLFAIDETELFTLEEIFQRIDHPYWRKVFKDFFADPPTLFIDSSPSNIRGFGYFPIRKYELLKRFILDNYYPVTAIQGMVIYRFKKKISQANSLQ